MKKEELPRCRLFNQGISTKNRASPEEVVRHLGAVQAQDYRAALWAIGLRCKNATMTDVEKAIARCRIVRTWPLRHTLHFVSPKDVRWMLAFYPKEKIPKFQRNNGLTDAVLEEGISILAKAFDKKERLTYPEMHKALSGTGISALDKNEVQSHIIRRAGRDGLICFGPHGERKPTFMMLEKWVPATYAMNRIDAAAERALRYFTSHGPATIYDFMWWSGLRSSDARTGIEKAAGKLSVDEIGGKAYYSPRRRESAAETAGVHLLPAFDEYIVSYKDRSAMLANRRTQLMLKSGKVMYATPNGIFLPTIVMEGQVLGTWKTVREKGKAAIAIRPFVRFTKEQANGIKEAAVKYGEFLGSEVALER